MIDVSNLSEEAVRKILSEVVELRQKAWAEMAGPESANPDYYDTHSRVWRNAEGGIVPSAVDRIKFAKNEFFDKVGNLLDPA